jgi:hypothetical protein
MSFIHRGISQIRQAAMSGIFIIAFEGATCASMAVAATTSDGGSEKQRQISASNPQATVGPTSAACIVLSSKINIPFLCPHRGRDNDVHATPLAIYMTPAAFAALGSMPS